MAENCVAGQGLEQEGCEGGPVEQCCLSLPDHSHVPRLGGWSEGGVLLFLGEQKEGKRGKVHRMQRGKCRALEQGAKEFVALLSSEVLENQLHKAMDNTA